MFDNYETIVHYYGHFLDAEDEHYEWPDPWQEIAECFMHSCAVNE
jgi:hypothetical protein